MKQIKDANAFPIESEYSNKIEKPGLEPGFLFVRLF